MTQRCILVVEDEPLIAADIRDVLEGFGYDVPATASTSEGALRAVERFQPDLILMDVRLKGGDDGVATAAAIRDRWPVPVVFLTSHADDATLARAQGVEPFGYLLKPFNEFELRSTIQIVLRRSLREESILDQSRVLAVAVNGAPDAMVAVDLEGMVLFANEAAQQAEGDANASHPSPWTTGSEWIRLADGTTPCPAKALPLMRALQGENVSDFELFVLSRTAGAGGCLYSVNAAPLRDGAGHLIGAVAIARDVTALHLSLLSLHQLSATGDLTGAYWRGFMEGARASLKNRA